MPLERLVKLWFSHNPDYIDPFTGEKVGQDEAIARFLSDTLITPEVALRRLDELESGTANRTWE